MRYIESFIHPRNLAGVLVELETDVEGANEKKAFQELARDVALQVVAASPGTVDELLLQQFIKDPTISVSDQVGGVAASLGGSVRIRRFIRYCTHDR